MQCIKHALHVLIMSWQRVHEFFLYARQEQIFVETTKIFQ